MTFRLDKKVRNALNGVMDNVWKRYRRHADLTQQQLADRLGVTQTAISKYETGDREPDRDTAYNFLRVTREDDFSCTLEDVYPEPTAA